MEQTQRDFGMEKTSVLAMTHIAQNSIKSSTFGAMDMLFVKCFETCTPITASQANRNPNSASVTVLHKMNTPYYLSREFSLRASVCSWFGSAAFWRSAGAIYKGARAM